MLFQDYMNYWYLTYRCPKHAQTTAETIKGLLRVHVMDSTLGKLELAAVKTSDVQMFLSSLLLHGNKSSIPTPANYGKPLSHWTVGKLRQLIIAALEQARKEGLVASNAAQDTEPVPLRPSSVNPFSVEAQQQFLRAASNHRYYAAYLLLFYTGCRRSEILGLSWNQIDWRRSCFTVSQTLVRVNGKPVLNKRQAKTARSLRTIPIPQDIKRVLGELRERQHRESRNVAGWSNPHNLVFTQKNGSCCNPMGFSQNFKNTVKRLGLPDDLHVHSARHSWATNMVQLGVPITDIQALGGWSRPDVLLGIYAQTVQKSQRKAINKLYSVLQCG